MTMPPSQDEPQIEWRFEGSHDGPSIARFDNQDIARLERRAELVDTLEPWLLTYGKHQQHEFRFAGREQALDWVRDNLLLLSAAAAEK
jgi:hypothetical protein